MSNTIKISSLIFLIFLCSCKTTYYMNSCGDQLQGKIKIRELAKSNCGFYKYCMRYEGEPVFLGEVDTVNFRMKKIVRMPFFKRLTSGKILKYKAKKVFAVIEYPFVFVGWLFSPEAKDW